jgi:hypothetical protein
MIYRIQIDNHILLWDEHGNVRWDAPLGLGGPGPALAFTMNELGLPAPDFDNPRARFYFTEAGWQKFGRVLAAEAKSRGHVVQVIRRKNPRKSQIVYEDEHQVAILPPRRSREREGTAARHETVFDF